MKLSLVEKLEAIAVGLLVIWAVIALVHRDGEKKGAVRQELKANAVVVEAEKADVATEVKKSVAKRAEYHAARAKVVVEGDTVIADGKTVELPSVASLIRVADSRGAQDSASMAKQDLLIGTLGKRVDLLEDTKQPWCGRKCGIAIGVGGTAAAVYIAVRIIKAVAHK